MSRFCPKAARLQTTGLRRAFPIDKANRAVVSRASEKQFSGLKSFDYGWDFSSCIEIWSLQELSAEAWRRKWIGSLVGVMRSFEVGERARDLEGCGRVERFRIRGGKRLQRSEVRVEKSGLLKGSGVEREVEGSGVKDYVQRPEQRIEQGVEDRDRGSGENRYGEVGDPGRGEFEVETEHGKNKARKSDRGPRVKRSKPEKSKPVRRALARYVNFVHSTSQGKLVRAPGQLALCGRRPQRLIGDNMRQIETCIRPRSVVLSELE